MDGCTYRRLQMQPMRGSELKPALLKLLRIASAALSSLPSSIALLRWLSIYQPPLVSHMHNHKKCTQDKRRGSSAPLLGAWVSLLLSVDGVLARINSDRWLGSDRAVRTQVHGGDGARSIADKMDIAQCRNEPKKMPDRENDRMRWTYPGFLSSLPSLYFISLPSFELSWSKVWQLAKSDL